MTIKSLFKVFMSLLGIGLILALWRAGAPVDTRGGWYALGVIMAVGGALPKELAYVSFSLAAAVMLHKLFWAQTSLFGLGWGHACFGACLAIGLMLLAEPTETRIVKCTKCFWHGPVTDARFGACPRCGWDHLKDENRSVLTGQ